MSFSSLASLGLCCIICFLHEVRQHWSINKYTLFKQPYELNEDPPTPTTTTKFTTVSSELHVCELICWYALHLSLGTNGTLNFVSCAEDLECCESFRIPCQSILGLITLHMYFQYMYLQTNFGQEQPSFLIPVHRLN